MNKLHGSVISFTLNINVNDELCTGRAMRSFARPELFLLTWQTEANNTNIKHRRWVLERDLFKPIKISKTFKALTPAFDD